MTNISLFKTMLLIFALSAISAVASAKYSGGTGEPNTPYQIADANDLLALAQNGADLSKYIVLIADINLASHSFTDCVIPTFSGNFNGNKFTISNVAIHGNFNSSDMGVWKQLNSATIQNLNLENINIENINTGFNTTSIGCLCGASNNNSSANNCNVTGSITIDGQYTVSYSGGLTGQNSGSINNCSFQGSVINKIHGAGGLVGRNLKGAVITNSTTNCYVESTERTGGFVGSNYGYISNCFVTADVYSLGLEYGYTDFAAGFAGHNCGYILNSGCIADIKCPGKMDAIGGFTALNFFNQYNVPSGIIENCYCQSNIDANECPQVGGFIGNNGGDRSHPTDPSYATGKCVIENCYSASTITLDDYTIDAAGFAGANFDSQISNCYWDRDILTAEITQSIAYDVNSIIENLTPLSTSQMKTQSSYTNWDFVDDNNGDDDIWFMVAGGYPRLAWQAVATDIYLDGIVNMKDYSLFANCWLNNETSCDFNSDGQININDLQQLAQDWLSSN